ncbi:DUF2513 domain-containing protein [Aeromonas veronii]|uniref:DUF2513 domain-containing protein n=1 Tax=Aeromonas veronii TaxID=654 RepID=UPI00191FC12E|nr:DUF2513 domain-containing protein [Aeromonas veronii]MBL0474394.1 DUF2513 domain-containing protein [Aeromonas veronii]
MKRDWDVVRLILTKLEELPDSLSTLTYIDFYADDRIKPDADLTELDRQVSYHMELLIEAGLVVGTMDDAVSLYAKEFRAHRLTWSGHEFLETIRSDTVWNKTKETFATKGIDMTFDLIKTVAGGVATSLLF